MESSIREFLNRIYIKRILSFAILIIVWQIASMNYLLIVLPSPFEVIGGFIKLSYKEDFANDIVVTVTRGIAGYLISMILGLGIATIFYMIKALREMFYSYVIVLQAIPRISWMLLAMIWFPFDSSIILFILIITLFPSVTISILEGYESIDDDLIDMARVYKVKHVQILRSIYLPAVLTHIVSISKITLGNTWKTLIMAELLTVADGLGARMGYLKTALATDQVIAVTLIIVIINCLCQFIITLLYNRMQRWKK